MKTLFKLNTMMMLATVFTVYTGCSPEVKTANTVVPTEQSSNIFGGQESTQNFQSQNGIVGLIITTRESVMIGGKISSEEYTALCTGTLIDRRLVLTAAHCVASSPNARVISVVAYFKPNIDLVTRKDIIVADRLAVHPDYMKGITEETAIDEAAWNDVALVRLSSDAPTHIKITPIANSTSALSVADNSTVVLSGFGIASPIVRKKVYNDKTKTWDVVTVEEQTPTSGVLRQVEDIVVTKVINDSKEFLLNQRNSKGACHGDSGGPAFLKAADGSLLQVGITSRGTNELGNCDEDAIYTSVAAHSAWIETTSIRLAVKQISAPTPEQASAPQAGAPEVP